MSDFLTLARTIYGEARGETLDGKIAVAWVIKNRAAEGGWWGANIMDVCLKPRQFSCWDDHNRASMMSATENTPMFKDCLYAAIAVLGGHIQDPTSGSCHYAVVGTNPKWAEGKTPVCTIGAHEFWNDID